MRAGHDSGHLAGRAKAEIGRPRTMIAWLAPRKLLRVTAAQSKSPRISHARGGRPKGAQRVERLRALAFLELPAYSHAEFVWFRDCYAHQQDPKASSRRRSDRLS